ncbi:threonine--tRNA ligase [soil metagenome]
MEQNHLYNIRHSLSHLLAMAVLEQFPEAKLAIGPPVDNGFYYDFDLPRSLTPDDLPILEKSMIKLVNQKVAFTSRKESIAAAEEILKDQPYKLELLKDLAAKGETEVGFYTSGTFTDMCKGPHVASTAEILPKSFRLSHTAGAYWKGSEKNQMLQRIYGLAFETAEELNQYDAMMAEAKKRDHRVLGPQLGIYMLSEEVGSGFPLWMPRGETIKYLLQEYMRKKEQARGYQYVSTPAIANEKLYQRSGHATYYADDMFKFTDSEGVSFYIKPMNCPHHHMIYEKLALSYRDLPIKLAEAGGIYRHERSGTLSGLIRVRGAITQNDSHIYVTPAQLKAEFLDVLSLFKGVYSEVGIKDYWFRLSLPDFGSEKGKYGGDQQKWEDASNAIREALQEFGTPFVEALGEAAFYGPKLDVQVKNVTGKEDTIATSQVDILVPERMGLKYTDEHGQEQVPIVIHRAILGSYERFTAFLIEQTAGNFPFWLAPIQVAILPVSDQCLAVAKDLSKALMAAGYRVEVDASTESVGKKIRGASIQKIPLKLVVGEQEAESMAAGWSLKPNWRTDLQETMGEEALSLQQLIEKMAPINHA